MMNWKEKVHKLFSWTEIKTDWKNASSLKDEDYCIACLEKIKTKSRANTWITGRLVLLMVIVFFVEEITRWIL